MKKAMLTLGVAAVGSLLMVSSAFAAEANYLFKLPANTAQTVADPVVDKSIEKYFPAILPTAQQQNNVTDSSFSKFFPAMLPVAPQADQPAANNTIQKFYPAMLPTQEAAPASGNEAMKKFYPNVLPETTQEAPPQKPSHIIFG